ncbi:MAG: hypothetical protein IJL02_07990 [Methanobrevibacter sp.]|uniref:hypothetical protein n=1 Tax=Methanobrevibacter sp. TaxID=66852 RepID=UPI0025FE6861|nr:hypothetical protein [Methanobrevibacter sp.]MBQ6099777.1 hypothetical protein [Methanobrevibacter sp.]
MKFKNMILVLSLMLCILFSISSVAASDVNDTVVSSSVSDAEVISIDENQVSNEVIGKSNNGDFTELQVKIIMASEGDTINLDKDYSFNTDSNITTGVFINKNLTINGNGHTIDGMSKSRIFNILYGLKDNNHVVLKNIVFKNGFAKIYGGAILNFADLVVDNCQFINNYADTAGGAINSLGSLNLKNSKFDKNVARGDAGAVFSLNLVRGNDLFKSLNTTDELTVMLNVMMDKAFSHGKDYISNCVFTNNVANGNGGGAVYAFSHIDIKSSTFNSNKAGEKGAAVYGCKDLFIKNSNFNKNKVGMYGGAVYFKCHEMTGHYENGRWVSSVKYYSNLIENSVFADNVAGERGGAIYGFKSSASDKHAAKAVKCTFSDNKAPNGKDIYGGTVSKCIYKNTKITINTVTIKKSAKKLVLTATLKKGSSPLKNKQVTFKFNGKTYKVKTNSKGIAKWTINKNVLKKLKVGKKITYQVSYGSFTAKKTAKVKK